MHIFHTFLVITIICKFASVSDAEIPPICLVIKKSPVAEHSLPLSSVLDLEKDLDKICFSAALWLGFGKYLLL